MKAKHLYILVIIFNYFFSFSLSAQTEDKLYDYESLSLNDKLEIFNDLSDSEIIENTTFLLNNLPDNLNNDLDDHLFLKLNLAYADLHYFNNDYIKSINTLKTLLGKEQLSVSNKVEVLSKLKRAYYKLQLYSDIFELNTKIKDYIKQGAEYPLWTYNMNSRLYAQLKMYDKAASTLRRELEELIAEDKGEPLIVSSGFNDLGYYFFKAENYNLALLNYNKALSYAEQNLKGKHQDHYRDITALVKGNIAEVYVVKEKYKEAIPLLIEDIEIGLLNSGNLQSTANSYNLLVKCYIKIGQYYKAKSTLEKIPYVLSQLTNKDTEVIYLKNTATYYYKINQKDSAYSYFNKAFKLKNVIDKNDLNKLLASNELVYTREQEKKLVEQHKINLINQEVRFKDKLNKVITFLAVFLSIILFISLYNGYFLKKSRKEIKLKNEQIKIALSEKEVLLKEVHHRVKNNLQIISGLLDLQSINIDNDKVKILLKEGQNRIQSVALMHKMMYQSDAVSKVNMQNYLEELLSVLESSYRDNTKNILISIVADNIDFSVTTAVPVSLIVNEAVCNAYKHAFVKQNSGKISIKLIQLNEDAFELSIKDDGVGLDKDFKLDKISSIGFDLISGLSRQLKGKLSVLNSEGALVKVIFKGGI
ncbi:tetratricopeptide repeat-containing sensor histidine kinase [Pseudofulvibacter geojedonensis]|uniref:histidine kinase n=1 Tax=Pseudofulvibacter geojedonensis TaxID=1123758 RepID=A0ABW3I2K3_9FLAO